MSDTSGQCHTCWFWRVKSCLTADAVDGRGICDNPAFFNRVTTGIGEDGMVASFKIDRNIARTIVGIHTDCDFGCRFHEPIENEEAK